MSVHAPLASAGESGFPSSQRPDLHFKAFAHLTAEVDELLMARAIFIDEPAFHSPIQDMIETVEDPV